ncbi:hypothetical protein BHE74_00008541 [Ensete ventricosum]|nr:hypothetical protein GW17_00050451 [Ensete ventricosum]RWW82972.1 hypothetical protein BHE74_00008541 [Ensete ventricosum]RZR87332.1 hypothetical protein BHM03_00014708 [Ensete ventricosum]
MQKGILSLCLRKRRGYCPAYATSPCRGVLVPGQSNRREIENPQFENPPKSAKVDSRIMSVPSSTLTETPLSIRNSSTSTLARTASTASSLAAYHDFYFA